MKDPQEAIRTAYFTRLNGAVMLDVLNGAPPPEAPTGGALDDDANIFDFTPAVAPAVPVYSYFVPASATRPYILLSQQTVADGRTGNCPSADTSILVEVVTEYEGQAVRASDADRIASQVIDLLDTFQAGGSLEGFEFNRHYLESSNMLNEINGARMINRRLLRFRDVVFELVN